jgi:hypothetical protein
VSSNSKYTYEDAGFNAFMLRSLKSNPGAQNVMGGISSGVGSGGSIAFDRQSVEGMLGDKLTIGRIILDGVAGRMIVLDTARTTETGWVGDLTDS